MEKLNNIVKRMDSVVHSMEGVCDGCLRFKPTQCYSFDDGDRKLCIDCTTESPWVEKLYDQYVEEMKQEQRDNDRKEDRYDGTNNH